MFYRESHICHLALSVSLIEKQMASLQIPKHPMMKRSARWRRHISNTAYPGKRCLSPASSARRKAKGIHSSSSSHSCWLICLCRLGICQKPGRGADERATALASRTSCLWSDSHSGGRGLWVTRAVVGSPLKTWDLGKVCHEVEKKGFKCSFICPSFCPGAVLGCCWGKVECGKGEGRVNHTLLGEVRFIVNRSVCKQNAMQKAEEAG